MTLPTKSQHCLQLGPTQISTLHKYSLLSLVTIAITVLALFAIATVPALTTVAGASESVDVTASELSEAAAPEVANTQRVASFQILQYFAMPHEELWVARITAELAETEELPAVVEIAVPQHSAVYFFGDGDWDEFPHPYTMRTENGFDIYTGLLTKSRLVTIEYTLDASPAAAGPSMNLSYTPLNDVEQLQLIVALPLGAAVIDPSFEDMGIGPDGEPAFAQFIDNAQGGTTYDVNIPYIMTTGNPSQNPLIIGGVIAALAVFGGLIFWLFSRSKRKE